MKTIRYVVYIAVTLLLATVARASDYKCESRGSEMLRKGEVITILVNKPKEICYKIDRIEFDSKRGTLKNVPKD